MKKIIALLLLATMCFSLMACGNKAEKKIAGEWETKSGSYFIVFNEDGTGKGEIDGIELDIRWKYDQELSCYTVAFDGGYVCCFYDVQTNEEGARYIFLQGYKFYFKG